AHIPIPVTCHSTCVPVTDHIEVARRVVADALFVFLAQIELRERESVLLEQVRNGRLRWTVQSRYACVVTLEGRAGDRACVDAMRPCHDSLSEIVADKHNLIVLEFPLQVVCD